MGSTNVETPLDYKIMVPRFEDMNDELDFIDEKLCDIDDDIKGHFEWARKETNCENIKTLTRDMLMKPKITKEKLAEQLLSVLATLKLSRSLMFQADETNY